LKGHEERVVHQDSQVKRENWAYQDLPAILVLQERKETKAWRARMDIREKREIGYVTASLCRWSTAVCGLEIPNRTAITIYISILFMTGQSVKLHAVRYTTKA
jgi:hypothetical protein